MSTDSIQIGEYIRRIQNNRAEVYFTKADSTYNIPVGYVVVLANPNIDNENRMRQEEWLKRFTAKN